MSFFRDIAKHGAIYGIGQVLTRLSSLLLLPIYTRYLSPSDYGVIAILDLVSGLLAILVGSGMASAVNRYHFETDEIQERSVVWWTGTMYVMLMALIITVPIWMSASSLSALFIDPAYDGDLLILITVVTLFLNTVKMLPNSYLRVKKWSILSVVISFAGLLFNIAVNLLFLIYYNMGVEGILLGNLLTAILMFLVAFGIFIYNQPITLPSLRILKGLIKFGYPLILTSILGMLLHEADLFFVNQMLGSESLGIYSVAYKISQGMSSLVLISFNSIWMISVYEIAKRDDYRDILVQAFDLFFVGMSLVMLTVSLFSNVIIKVLVPEAYYPAADIVPVICLAYLIYSLHIHFQVPALLQKRTVVLIPVFVVATLINALGNLIFIPSFGLMGAALSTVISFIAYSFYGLVIYRRIDKVAYKFGRPVCIMLGMILAYGTFKFFSPSSVILEFFFALTFLLVVSFVLIKLYSPVIKKLFIVSELTPKI